MHSPTGLLDAPINRHKLFRDWLDQTQLVLHPCYDFYIKFSPTTFHHPLFEILRARHWLRRDDLTQLQ